MPRLLDPAAAEAHLRAADPVMARLIESVGPMEPARPESYEPFRVLTRAIVFQQLSGKAAETIFGRFVAKFGGAAFPDPAAVLSLPEPLFREAGLSRQKTAALLSLAEHFGSGELAAEALLEWEDEDVIAHLTRVRASDAGPRRCSCCSSYSARMCCP